MVAAHNNNTFQLIACSSSPYRFPWFATHFQPWDLSSRSFCMNLLGFCSYGVCVFCWLTVREFQRMEPNLASILNAAFKSVHTMSKMQWITSRDFSNETKSNPAPQGPNGNVPKFQPRMFARKKNMPHTGVHTLKPQIGRREMAGKGWVCLYICDYVWLVWGFCRSISSPKDPLAGSRFAFTFSGRALFRTAPSLRQQGAKSDVWFQRWRL